MVEGMKRLKSAVLTAEPAHVREEQLFSILQPFQRPQDESDPLVLLQKVIDLRETGQRPVLLDRPCGGWVHREHIARHLTKRLRLNRDVSEALDLQASSLFRRV